MRNTLTFSFYRNFGSNETTWSWGHCGGSDAQTPQHPSTSHILVRLFSSPFVAQRTKTPGAHETPPPHTLDHACDGLQGESHEDIGSAQPEHCYLGAHMFKSQEHSPSSIWWTKTWFP
jgi:hypothetical protein